MGGSAGREPERFWSANDEARLRVWPRIEVGEHAREIKDLRQVWGAAGPAGDGPAPGLLRPTRSSASSAAYRLSRSRRPARPFLDLVLLRLLDILAALFLASHCVPPSAFVRIVTRAGAGPYAAEERRRPPHSFPQASARIMAGSPQGVKSARRSGQHQRRATKRVAHDEVLVCARSPRTTAATASWRTRRPR